MHFLTSDHGGFYAIFSGWFPTLLSLGSLAGLVAVYRHMKCVNCRRLGHHKTPDTGQRFCRHCYTHAVVAVHKANHRVRFPHHIAHTPPSRHAPPSTPGRTE